MYVRNKCVYILLCLWRLDNHSNIGHTLANTHTYMDSNNNKHWTVFVLTCFPLRIVRRYVNAMLRLARFWANWRFAWCDCEPYQAAARHNCDRSGGDGDGDGNGDSDRGSEQRQTQQQQHCDDDASLNRTTDDDQCAHEQTDYRA